MTEKVIIFDFDGTIADSMAAIVTIANCLAGEFGYKQTSQEQLIQFKSLNSREVIKQSGVSIFKLPFLIRKVKVELNKQIQEVSSFPGIKEALVELKRQGNRLIIITSNSKENVIAFLEEHELQELFDFIYSGTTFGKSKVINKFLRENNINPEQAIYVGDETRDIEAARKSNIRAIAVTWGFNSKELLAAQNPDFLIHQPNELIDVVGSL